MTEALEIGCSVMGITNTHNWCRRNLKSRTLWIRRIRRRLNHLRGKLGRKPG